MSFFGNDLKGHSFFAYMLYGGLRYSLPMKMFSTNPKIGLDYNYGSKNYFMYYAPDTDGFNRFAVRGHHAEIYTILPIHRKANIRFVYIFEKHDYSDGLVKPVSAGFPKINEIIHNISASLNVYF